MEPIEDMPNQKPNPIGAGLAGLAQFFSDSKVDQAKLIALAGMLYKHKVTQIEMQKIVQRSMEECDRFPTLAWMLNVLKRNQKRGEGWESNTPHCSGALDAKLAPKDRRWLSDRSTDLWRISRALRLGIEPAELLDKWRLYVDHNRYVRTAPTGELVRTHFETEEQVAAERTRMGDFALPRSWEEG